jgi:fucose 4-O-acetylase-like acetyltransferase
MIQLAASALPASPTALPESVRRPYRYIWVDTAKGYGIILVVLAHAIRGLISSGIMTWTPITRFVDAWIYAFHMPLFFFLSGLFLSRSTEKPWGAFVSDKVRTIAYPYFVWSVISVVIVASLGRIPNRPYDFSDLPLILYAPIEQYWFLYVLFILLMVIAALLKLGVNRWIIFALAILSYPGLLPISSYWWVLAVTREMALYITLGVIVGRDRDLQTISGIQVGWLTLAVAAGLTVASFAGSSELSYRDAFQPVFGISGTAAVVALAVLTDKAKLDASIQFLGRYSLEIYVVHTIASAGTRIALLNFAHVSAPAAHLVLGTLAGLYMPIGLVLLFNRVGFRYAFTFPKYAPFLTRSDTNFHVDQARDRLS